MEDFGLNIYKSTCEFNEKSIHGDVFYNKEFALLAGKIRQKAVIIDFFENKSQFG